jgi:hypothetical protein
VLIIVGSEDLECDLEVINLKEFGKTHDEVTNELEPSPSKKTRFGSRIKGGSQSKSSIIS